MLKRLVYGFSGLCGLIIIATTAQAGVVASYPNFCPASGLTTVGSTTVNGSCQLQLTSAGTGESGAAYSTTPITLGAGDTFSTTFQFQFTNPGGYDPADGITFVLSAGSSGLGGSGGAIGYGGVPNSVAIEFDTYNNGSGDGNSSNHVAIDEDGNVNNGGSESDQDLTNVYGNPSCGFPGGSPSQNSNSVAGCMSNGDVWTVSIGYDGTNLSVTLLDPAKGFSDTIYSGLPVAIASLLGTNTAYVGFTSGTGDGYENHDILDWEFANDTSLAPSVPEPASLAVLGAGFAGLGWVRRRKKT